MNLENILIRKAGNKIKNDYSYLLLLNQYFDEMEMNGKPASNILLFFCNRYYDSSVVYDLSELVNELKEHNLYNFILSYLAHDELSPYLDLIKEDILSTDAKLDLFISKLVNSFNPKIINSIMMIARKNLNLEKLYNKFIEFKYCGQTLLDYQLKLLENLDDLILSDIFFKITKDQLEFLFDQTTFQYNHGYESYLKICKFSQTTPLSKFRYNFSTFGWNFSSTKRDRKDKIEKELFDYTK